MAKRRRGKQLSSKQLFDQTIVSTADLTLDENRDPSENAAGVILKYGVGASGTGKVLGGYLYYLDDDTWEQALFDSSVNAGAGHLYGVALGENNVYDKLPTEGGMLLRGVVTVFAYGTPEVGAVVYGNNLFSKYGHFTFTTPVVAGAHKQALGHCLKIINTAAISTVLIYFNPDSYYTVI